MAGEIKQQDLTNKIDYLALQEIITYYQPGATMIKIPQFVKDLEAYKASKPIDELAREKKLNRIVKLASNENPLGPSPKALEAINKALTQLHRYPNPTSPELVQAISKKFDIQPQHIICGHGTDSLLAYIINAFTTEKDEILTSEGTFIGIFVNTRKFGRKLTKIPMKNYCFNLSAILENISESTKIIFLANPNNPTGTMFGYKQFEKFMQQVPNNILVILDEAYTTYATLNPDYPNGVRYEYENMVVLRTLSKAYGLAGLRIGFAVGPKYIIDALYKVKLPFEPNYLAQNAAIAALDDDEFLDRTVAINNKSLAIMKDKFTKLRIKQIETFTNFILLLMPNEQFAKEFYSGCLNKGLIVRYLSMFGIPNGIRINSGTEEEILFALDIIETVYTKLYQSINKTNKSIKGTKNEVRILQD